MEFKRTNLDEYLLLEKKLNSPSRKYNYFPCNGIKKKGKEQ